MNKESLRRRYGLLHTIEREYIVEADSAAEANEIVFDHYGYADLDVEAPVLRLHSEQRYEHAQEVEE